MTASWLRRQQCCRNVTTRIAEGRKRNSRLRYCSVLLSCIAVPSYLLNEDGSNVFNKWDILNIEQFYMDIICALFEASCGAIPRKKYNFYKYWWDEELVLLKDKAIQSFNLSGRLLVNHMSVMSLMI